MLEFIKRKFYEYLTGLGYNVDDNGTYREQFPWLMLRTNDATVTQAIDTTMAEVRLIVDIFSTHNGEKEILDIIDNIITGLPTLIKNTDCVQHVILRSLRIIDDKETGPVRKHGIANFSFILAEGDEISDGE